ncbi:hypothetical protein [Novosphingobium album (ex Hu et al. 2023)]|uniref:Copper-binding protein n=1 Tax=Novosphingobium album (ex Hu et al. 2023) TaxID=2930093 RepID=A0ABT0B842_9SPHN|nr:hypothetical protein [Novosphingobium album (ex Hu et al. 2023)]MCJ2180989.1 hypothetical protein [Novosphingobium album (ex Hu et al. 2023)]
MTKPYALLLSLAVVGGLASTAHAHGLTKPQHGGVVQMNGETLFELVRTPNGVSLYVIDEDEPVAASGMTAKLSVSAQGKRTDIPMTAGKGNQFFAPGVKIAPGSNVSVQVVDKATGARYGATFNIK